MKKTIEIEKPEVRYEAASGFLEGRYVEETVRTLGETGSIYKDRRSLDLMDGRRTAYRVSCHFEEKAGKKGGLFFGTSYVMPGKVGDEYFMTKGHFHSKKDTAEYYWCISGKGCLILMDEEGVCRAEEMIAGSLHYIGGNIAHRIANTDDADTLVVGACWPSDAGHDYETIAARGFSARLLEVGGQPRLVPEEQEPWES